MPIHTPVKAPAKHNLAAAYAAKRSFGKKKMASGGAVQNEDMHPEDEPGMAKQTQSMPSQRMSPAQMSHGQLPQPEEPMDMVDHHLMMAEHYRMMAQGGAVADPHLSLPEQEMSGSLLNPKDIAARVMAGRKMAMGGMAEMKENYNSMDSDESEPDENFLSNDRDMPMSDPEPEAGDRKGMISGIMDGLRKRHRMADGGPVEKDPMWAKMGEVGDHAFGGTKPKPAPSPAPSTSPSPQPKQSPSPDPEDAARAKALDDLHERIKKQNAQYSYGK